MAPSCSHLPSFLCLLLIAVPNATSGAEPVRASCPPDAASCEFYLEARYIYSMMLEDPFEEGHTWTPVGANEHGLYTTGSTVDCLGSGRNLTAEEAARVVTADGHHHFMFSLNGSVPGPPMVVYKGQQVIVHLHNKLDGEAIALHFHGMHQRGTPYMDGAAKISQCAIDPEETFTYRFQAYPSGTYWYHGHLGSTSSMGLYGALIVLDAEEDSSSRGDDPLPTMDQDYVMFLKDLTALPTNEVNAVINKGGMQYFNHWSGVSEECTLPLFNYNGLLASMVPWYSGTINSKGRYYPADTREPENPYLPLETYHVTKGQLIYFRIVSTALTFSMRVSIDGHPLHIVSTDGNPLVTRVVDSLIISSGERYDLWINATDPHDLGSYWIRVETLEYMTHTGDTEGIVNNYVNAILHYEDGPTGDPVSSPLECTEASRCTWLNCAYDILPVELNTDCITLSQLRSPVPDNTLWPEDPAEESNIPEYFFNLDIHAVQGDIVKSHINGIENVLRPWPIQVYSDQAERIIVPCDWEGVPANISLKCTHLIKIPLGQIVQMVIFTGEGDSGPGLLLMEHPIHIHGVTVQVVGQGFPVNNQTTGQLNIGTPEIHCPRDTCSSGANWTEKHVGNDALIGPNGPKKDSFVVPPGGYIIVRLKADNPGYWSMHCHSEFHTIEGMGLVLQIGEPEEMPRAPERMRTCGDFHLTEEEYYEAIALYDSNEVPASPVAPSSAPFNDVTQGAASTDAPLASGTTRHSTGDAAEVGDGDEERFCPSQYYAIIMAVVCGTLGLLIGMLVMHCRHSRRREYARI